MHMALWLKIDYSMLEACRCPAAGAGIQNGMCQRWDVVAAVILERDAGSYRRTLRLLASADKPRYGRMDLLVILHGMEVYQQWRVVVGHLKRHVIGGIDVILRHTIM